MTIQEEIREGIRWQLAQVTENSEEATGVVLDYLNSRGVVIKVEGELPKYWFDRGICSYTEQRYIPHGLQDAIEEAGYVYTEPLIV